MRPILKKLKDHPHPLTADYFHGRERTPLPSPSNIIFFHRKSLEELAGEDQEAYFHHHRFVFIYSIHGNGNVLINEKAIPLKAGQSCLIYPYEIHYYSGIHDEEISWLFITFESDVDGWIQSLRNRSWQESDQIEDLVSRLLEKWMGNKAGLAHYLSLLLIELNETPGHAEVPEISSIFVKINQFLNQKPEYPWSIDELARETGYSAGHLRLRFREEVKTSLGNYIRRYRVTRAAQMLRNTTSRIGEIAELCGFESPYAFSRTFRKEIGLSPRMYRDQNAPPQTKRTPL